MATVKEVKIAGEIFKWRQAFDRYDKDGSGELSRSELFELVKELWGTNPEACRNETTPQGSGNVSPRSEANTGAASPEDPDAQEQEKSQKEQRLMEQRVAKVRESPMKNPAHRMYTAFLVLVFAFVKPLCVCRRRRTRKTGRCRWR